MSRLIGMGFILLDVTATLASMLNHSGVLMIGLLSLVTSAALATASATIRSVLFPSYFWDDTHISSRRAS